MQLTLQELVTDACTLALAACAGWLLLAVALAASSCVADVLAPLHPGSRRLRDVTDRLCPVPVRRVVAVVLGLTLTAGALAPAHADPCRQRPARTDPLARRLTGLLPPERTTDDAAPAPERPLMLQRAAPAHPRPGTVVVRPGDSLWSIAAARLGPGASDADVSGGWHRLLRRNAARIGPDPDLITPGTRLVLPAPLTRSRKEQS